MLKQVNIFTILENKLKMGLHVPILCTHLEDVLEDLGIIPLE